MPELPEVETVKNGLKQLIVGKTIQSVTFDTAKSFPNKKEDVSRYLIGSSVVSVIRRAKVIIIELDSKYSLLVHLKMTGQLVYKDKSVRFGAGHPNDSLIGKLPDKSTRVVLSFKQGGKLFFNDQRKFGWIKLIATAEIPNVDFFKKIGPDALAGDMTWQKFRERLLRRPRSGIKAVLLDQSIIAGLGSIYTDEVLWASRIHPSQPAADLSSRKIHELYDNIVAILRLAIAKGGSTDRNYVDAEGKKGSYLKYAKVFRLNGTPCQRCGTAIIKIRVAGRGTHICPSCQRIGG